jgi:hypothetical protein
MSGLRPKRIPRSLLLIDKLIEVLGQEQKHVRDEIQSRLIHRIRAMEKDCKEASEYFGYVAFCYDVI